MDSNQVSARQGQAIMHPARVLPALYSVRPASTHKAGMWICCVAFLQVEQLLQHLQQQQDNSRLLLLDATSSAATHEAAAHQHQAPPEFVKLQPAVTQEQQQFLQDLCARLAAAYGLQVQVVPQRPAGSTGGTAVQPPAQEQQQPYQRQAAVQSIPEPASRSSSSSSSMGSLLLSGLGQAGRAAATAASAAAAAVLDAVEGAAAAASAAVAAVEHRGVDMAADLPDTCLRPR